jgi:hypothetical protein
MRSILRPGAGLLALSIVVLLTAYLCPSSAGYAQTRPGRKGPTGVKPTPAPETPGVAQKPQPAPRKVTVNLRNGDPVTGSLLKADAETIEIEVAGNRLTIKWDDVSSVTTPGAVEAKPAESAGSPGAGVVAPGPAAGASEQKAAPQTPADPTGDWQLSLTASTGQTLPVGTLHIEKAGAGYSATLQAAGQRLEAISPLITDKEVSLTFSNLEQGKVVKMLLAGTIEGDVIKGSMSLDEPGAQRGSFTATRSTAAAGSPADVGVLSIQVGIVYKMGGSQAVARVPFFLLNKDLNAILSDAGLSPDRGMNLLQTFAFATRYQSQSKYAQFYQVAMRAVQPHVVAQTMTGFDGVGQFPAVSAGVYYVMGYTQTRGGFALWNVSVGVPTGQSSFVLDQNNAAIAL